MGEIDLKKYQIRTDLIIESIDTEKKTGLKQKLFKYDNITVSDITIRKELIDIGKKKGKYITISFDDVTDSNNRRKVESVFSKELRKILKYLKLDNKSNCLVIGLGNDKSTPDALGPKVLENIIVTRHLYLIDGVSVDEGYRNVSGFIPGVMGTTGIEAADVVKGIIEKIGPDFVIVVDALASSSIDRVNKTIQMTTTGINPGSGVGNSRAELSEQTLGLPVIAVGIPTVVDAVTIVSNTFDYLLKKFSHSKQNINKHSNKLKPVTSLNYLEEEIEELSIEDKTKILGIVGNLEDQEIRQLIFEVLTPIGYNMMVTPKEVDFVIDKLSKVISTGINNALHIKLKKI